jgi:hypothetical protein
MSDKEFEPCTLEEATHVEVNGKLHELGDGNVIKIQGGLDIYMKHWNSFLSIYECVFSVLAIKPMKKIKRYPIVFEADFAKYAGDWYQLHTLDHEASYLHSKKATFKCVEIVEEEK